MKNTLNTIENETSKWFRRFTGVVMAMIVSALFLMGFIFIAGACVGGSWYSIVLLILGVAMIYWSSKSIDSVLIKFGYKKEAKVNKERSLKRK